MFIAVRDAKCSRLRRRRAGHDGFSQRQTTASSSRCSRLWHSGQCVGICHGSPRGTPSGCGRIALTTFGMTSPPFSISTRSPGRTSLRATSSALCSVAIEIVLPASLTGSSTAYGVTAPVRPTFTSIAFSVVVACCAGNLNAVAQRGNFAVAPSVSRSARSSTLMTTPSVSNSSACRLSPHSAQNATTSSMFAQRRQCDSTGSPHDASAVSVSACAPSFGQPASAG